MAVKLPITRPEPEDPCETESLNEAYRQCALRGARLTPIQ